MYQNRDIKTLSAYVQNTWALVLYIHYKILKPYLHSEIPQEIEEYLPEWCKSMFADFQMNIL
jgi:hypothetical protein